MRQALPTRLAQWLQVKGLLVLLHSQGHFQFQIVHLLRPFLIPYESDDTARYPTMHFTTAKRQQWQKFNTLMSADNVHVFISVGR